MAHDEEGALPIAHSFINDTNFYTRAKAAYRHLLREPASPCPPNHEHKRLKRTAYLDGLRGVAALLVYLLHNQIWGHPAFQGGFVMENAFGWIGHYYFAALPGIRILFSGGHFAVAVFFLISGYVLALTPLKLIYSGEFARLAEHISSALFRRWPRLFLPILVTTFIWMTSWHVFGIKSNNSITDAKEPTYARELQKFYNDFTSFSNPLSDLTFYTYNDHMWSIKLEFRGSLAIWTTLLATARATSNMRLCIMGGLICYLTYVIDGWYCACFIIGMFLCDFDLLAERNQLPAILSRLQSAPSWIYYLLMFVGLYLAGEPSIKGDFDEIRLASPGWYYLFSMVPGTASDFRWFYRMIAATLVMISIPRISTLKQLFESRPCQFLGKVSYAFYLVHGPILWSIGDRLYAAVGRTEESDSTNIPGWIDICRLPNWGPLGLEVNFLVAQMILLPLTLWTASIVTRTIDDPIVKLSRWLYEYCTAAPACI
jgi:peptidoglycan/LPS O-acetylase OafA/YrhL